MKPTAPVLKLENGADALAALAADLKQARRSYRKAREAKANVLKQLALAEIAEREAREAQAAVELRIYTMLGETPPRDEPISSNWRTISWDEVWCPRCKHTFLPSQPGGRANG